jgi:RNA polymerase sigma-70 factor (ECF subfamily)
MQVVRREVSGDGGVTYAHAREKTMTAAPHSSGSPKRTHKDGPAGGVATLRGPAEETRADERVAAGLIRGEEDALASAYARYGALVRTLARRSLGDSAEAEDVTQLVFLAAWRGRAGYRPERGTLGAWLTGIARRKVADALDARSRRSRLLADIAGDRGTARSASALADPEAALDRVLVSDELKRLPTAQRLVLHLVFHAGLTQNEIAARTGLPLGTVKSHSRRGLYNLRRRLCQADSDF